MTRAVHPWLIPKKTSLLSIHTLECFQRSAGDASGVSQILFPDAKLLMPHREDGFFFFLFKTVLKIQGLLSRCYNVPLECHQGHGKDRGSVATVSSLGMTTTLPWVPSCPSGRALEGTDGLWERPLAGRVIAQPGRVRRWREGVGRGS